jgi:hypothetical protein
MRKYSNTFLVLYLFLGTCIQKYEEYSSDIVGIVLFLANTTKSSKALFQSDHNHTSILIHDNLEQGDIGSSTAQF